jgi:putative flippase GtrA
MDKIWDITKIFLGFALLSGVGWLCDFLTFTLLVKLFKVHSFEANFVSSYVGVTFVWFASLKTVFKRSGNGRGTFLVVYWCFQFVSILVYSQSLHMVADAIPNVIQLEEVSQNSGIAAKIIITPFNLVTNFIFMKFLTRFMQKEYYTHV